MKYVITKIIKDQIYLQIDNKEQIVSIKGALRLHELKPVVGDYVECIKNDDQYLITNIYERKNFLIRPKAANVDVVVIVQSTISPNFDTILLDKMIAFYEQFNVEIVIAITKADKYCNKKIQQELSDYKKMHYQYFDINNPNEYENLLNFLKDKIVCFVGNSGVGKSTLINKINPHLNLRTQETSKALNRGKHTTTHTNLIFTNNFYLIDTPGYSTITLNYDRITLAHLFFHKLTKDSYCRFYDCLHLNNNIDCLIKELLNNGILIQWRYNNYLTLLNTIEVNKNDKYKN